MKIQITNIEMVRSSGYGQYVIAVDFIADGNKHSLSFHTTDSLLWDNDDKTDADLLLHIGGEQALLDRI